MSNLNHTPSYFPTIPHASPGYQWVVPPSTQSHQHIGTQTDAPIPNALQWPPAAGVQHMLPLPQVPDDTHHHTTVNTAFPQSNSLTGPPLPNQQAIAGPMSIQLSGRFRAQFLLPVLNSQQNGLAIPTFQQPEMQRQLAAALCMLQHHLQQQTRQLLLPQPVFPGLNSLPLVAIPPPSQPQASAGQLLPRLPAPNSQFIPNVSFPLASQHQNEPTDRHPQAIYPPGHWYPPSQPPTSVAAQPALINPVDVGKLHDFASAATCFPYLALPQNAMRPPKIEPFDDVMTFSRATGNGLLLAPPRNLITSMLPTRPTPLFPPVRPLCTDEEMQKMLAPFIPPPLLPASKVKKEDGLRRLVIRTGRQKRGPSGVIVVRHFQGEMTEKTREWFEMRGRKPFQYVVKKEETFDDYPTFYSSKNQTSSIRNSRKRQHILKEEIEEDMFKKEIKQEPI